MVVSKEVFKCEECKYFIYNWSYLKQYIDLIYNVVRLYKCFFCDYVGKRSYFLREYFIVYFNERFYICFYCNVIFRKKGYLINYEKLYKKLVKCLICIEWFLSLEIEVYMLEKYNVRKFLLCDICKFMVLDVFIFNKYMEFYYIIDS